MSKNPLALMVQSTTTVLTQAPDLYIEMLSRQISAAFIAGNFSELERLILQHPLVTRVDIHARGVTDE